jgi:fructan beta-fructosidase
MKIIMISLLLVLASCSFEHKNASESKELTEVDYRPAYHFTPESNWMNDPNGMVYYAGEYHLFYQYYPEGNTWGPMHWGHAISTDLLNWEHLPIALYPDDLGYIFSGSAVVDKDNTSGLKSGDEDVMVAIFTHHNMEKEKAGTHDHQYQSIAYSNDKGRTWVKYKGNPVLANDEKIHDFRDPKVMWHEASKQWVMTLAAGQVVKFYTSPNLLDWTYASDFGMELGAHGGVWECPDLFQMQVEGSDEKRWVLFVSINPGGPNGGSATQYFVGDFDGTNFITNQEETLWVDMGTDNYAGVTWSNAPDDRHLFLGWMSNWKYAQEVPTETWRSAMTLPREIKLMPVNRNEPYLLTNYPTKEVVEMPQESVYELSKSPSQLEIKDADYLAEAQFVLSTKVKLTESSDVTLKYGNDSAHIVLTYNKTTGELIIDRSESGFDF